MEAPICLKDLFESLSLLPDHLNRFDGLSLGFFSDNLYHMVHVIWTIQIVNLKNIGNPSYIQILDLSGNQFVGIWKSDLERRIKFQHKIPSFFIVEI